LLDKYKSSLNYKLSSWCQFHKHFTSVTYGANPIKLFKAVIYKFLR
jgi:hypothetical protein